MSRKNAMLTTEDRRWLTGEKTYEGQHAKQQRYQRRNDIRERVYNSILDFTILFEHLGAEERAKIFGEVTDDGRQWTESDDGLRNGVVDAFAFLLGGIDVGSFLREPTSSEATVADQLLKAALVRAGQREGFLVEGIDIEVDATEVAIPDVMDALRAGDDVSPAELYLLMESDIIDSGVVEDCLRDRLFRDDREGE